MTTQTYTTEVRNALKKTAKLMQSEDDCIFLCPFNCRTLKGNPKKFFKKTSICLHLMKDHNYAFSSLVEFGVEEATGSLTLQSVTTVNSSQMDSVGKKLKTETKHDFITKIFFSSTEKAFRSGNFGVTATNPEINQEFKFNPAIQAWEGNPPPSPFLANANQALPVLRAKSETSVKSDISDITDASTLTSVASASVSQRSVKIPTLTSIPEKSDDVSVKSTGSAVSIKSILDEAEEEENEEAESLAIEYKPCNCKPDWDVRCVCVPKRWQGRLYRGGNFLKCPERTRTLPWMIHNEYELHKPLEDLNVVERVYAMYEMAVDMFSFTHADAVEVARSDYEDLTGSEKKVNKKSLEKTEAGRFFKRNIL